MDKASGVGKTEYLRRKAKLERELNAAIIQAAARGGNVRKQLNKRVKELQRELNELAASEDGASEPVAKPRDATSTKKASKRDGSDPNQMRQELRLYVKQLEQKQKALKLAIEKLKQERLYVDLAGKKRLLEKRREAQKELEEVAVELEKQRELQKELRDVERETGRLVGERSLARAPQLERFEAMLTDAQRRWRVRRERRASLPPPLTTVRLRLRLGPPLPTPPAKVELGANPSGEPLVRVVVCASGVGGVGGSGGGGGGGGAASHVFAQMHVRHVPTEAEAQAEEEAEAHERRMRWRRTWRGVLLSTSRQQLVETMLAHGDRLPQCLLRPPRKAHKLRLELEELEMTGRLSEMMLNRAMAEGLGLKDRATNIVALQRRIHMVEVEGMPPSHSSNTHTDPWTPMHEQRVACLDDLLGWAHHGSRVRARLTRWVAVALIRNEAAVLLQTILTHHMHRIKRERERRQRQADKAVMMQRIVRGRIVRQKKKAFDLLQLLREQQVRRVAASGRAL